MAEHKYDFEITMTCGGCSGAVDRVLKKLEGEFPSPSPLRRANPAVNPSCAATDNATRPHSPLHSTPIRSPPLSAPSDKSYQRS